MNRLRYWTNSTRTKLLWVITLLCCALGLVHAVNAQTDGDDGILTDDNLVILEVRLGSRILSQGLIAFQYSGGVLMPLGALTDILEFAIDVNPSTRRASGWFIDETRRFTLDLAAASVVSEGQTHTLSPAQATADYDDIYVDTTLLADWFPIGIDVRVNQLLAVLTAEELLPLQSRLKREAIRERRLSTDDIESRQPLQKATYQTFTWPLIDANIEYRGRNPQMTPKFSVQTSGDVGTLETHTFMSHTDGAKVVNAARIRAGRTDSYGELLGPLQATQFEFGDLYAPSTPLVLRGKLGRGLLLSNRPLRRPDRFDTTDISGDGTPGWDVELYGNHALLDFAVVDETGRYLFEDVPMIFGRNVFRAVLYGPQGQIREQTRIMNVGAGMIPPGEIEYRLFGVQNDRFLVTGDHLLGDTLDRGRWTGHLEAGYGLSQSLSLNGSLTRQPVAGVDHTYLSLTASGLLGGYHLQAVGANALDGGIAGSLSMRGELFGRSLLAEQKVYSDFISDANPENQQQTSQTRLRLGGAALWRGRNLAYDFMLQSTGYTGRGITRQDRMTLRAATRLRGMQVSSKLDYRNSTSVASAYNQIFLDQLARGVWGPLMLRGSVHARLAPGSSIDAVSGSASWSPLHKLKLASSVTHRFDDAVATTFGGTMALLMDSFNLSLSAHTSGAQKPYFSIALTTSVTKVPESTRMHVQRHRMSTGYGATARVFLDRNANGHYDDQDDPLPEVRITGAGSWNDAVTGRNGITYLAGLPAHREHDLSLDLATLQDPFLLPAVENVRATGHPGGHVVLDFPVTYSGDIEGTVYARTPSGDVPMRNIGLELVDLSQRTIRRTVSEFDGYYLFQEIPPGWYEVHIIPETLERKRLRMPAPVAAQVPTDGGVSDRNDFILRFEEERRASR